MIKPTKTSPTILAVSALAAALTTASLAEEEKRADFSHKAHMQEGAGCTDCHKTEGPGDLPVLSGQACQDCHDDGAPAWRLATKARRLRIRFPHKLHAEAAKCKDCHQQTAEDIQAAGEPMTAQPACMTCHQENGVEVKESACAACHAVNQRWVVPADHKRAWASRHGRESQWRVFERHGDDCFLCHRRDACLTCHKTNRPKSHTGLWRIRTHGLAASFDRNACKTCHETGMCIRCHQTTAPLNHRGPWGATHGLAAQTKQNEHCLVCHRKSWCDACHLGDRR